MHPPFKKQETGIFEPLLQSPGRVGGSSTKSLPSLSGGPQPRQKYARQPVKRTKKWDERKSGSPARTGTTDRPGNGPNATPVLSPPAATHSHPFPARLTHFFQPLLLIRLVDLYSDVLKFYVPSSSRPAPANHSHLALPISELIDNLLDITTAITTQMAFPIQSYKQWLIYDC
ncbi:hypothetical protein A0H81_03671 [Grifola frondosa]|uniref:Uncharacterized protein n=1 Tax=Grifola frondosa TaxID=5627 RepID=A0A1C7MJC8_GRIFR|nr:hypothetical protein A0H81_03671 [Grifola frondosa]